MSTLYTSAGSYILRKKSRGLSYPVIILNDKEYHLSIPEMILWTKGMWSICTHDFLHEAFRKEEQVLGEMNFDAILNRLIQRGLILSGEAQTDIDALYNLIGDLVIISADVSIFSQFKNFLYMTIVMNVPAKAAKTVFKKYELTDDEKLVLHLTRNKNMTVSSLTDTLDMDKTIALSIISNLYLKKLVSFRGQKAESL